MNSFKFSSTTLYKFVNKSIDRLNDNWLLPAKDPLEAIKDLLGLSLSQNINILENNPNYAKVELNGYYYKIIIGAAKIA